MAIQDTVTGSGTTAGVVLSSLGGGIMPGIFLDENAVAAGDAYLALMANATIHLFKDEPITIVPGTSAESLNAIECDFSGYVPLDQLFAPAAYVNPDGGWQSAPLILTFVAAEAEPFVSDIVGGYYILTAGGLAMLAGKLENPYPIGSPDSVLNLIVQLIDGVPVASVAP